MACGLGSVFACLVFLVTSNSSIYFFETEQRQSVKIYIIGAAFARPSKAIYSHLSEPAKQRKATVPTTVLAIWWDGGLNVDHYL
jgi:hypothetical protein